MLDSLVRIVRVWPPSVSVSDRKQCTCDALSPSVLMVNTVCEVVPGSATAGISTLNWTSSPAGDAACFSYASSVGAVDRHGRLRRRCSGQRRGQRRRAGSAWRPVGREVDVVRAHRFDRRPRPCRNGACAGGRSDATRGGTRSPTCTLALAHVALGSATFVRLRTPWSSSDLGRDALVELEPRSRPRAPRLSARHTVSPAVQMGAGRERGASFLPRWPSLLLPHAPLPLPAPLFVRLG